MDEIKDMNCRIHRLEDKLLRSKNFQDQIQINNVLMIYRKKLQELIWDRETKGLYYKTRLDYKGE